MIEKDFMLMAQLAGYGNVSTFQLACGVFFGGNNEIAHSLQMANMGLGSVITFGGVYLMCEKQIMER